MAGSKVWSPSRVVHREFENKGVSDDDGVRGLWRSRRGAEGVGCDEVWLEGRRLVKTCQRLEYGFAVCLSCIERKKKQEKKNNSDW